MGQLRDDAGTPASPIPAGAEGGGKLARRLMLALKLGATLLALVLVARLVDPAVLLQRVRAADPLVLAAALVLIVVQIPLVALRWRRIVAAMSREGGAVPAWSKFFQIAYIAQFMGQVLPFVAGDGMRVLMLHEAGPSLRVAFKSALLDRGLATLALFVLALPALMFSPILANAKAYLWPIVALTAGGLAGAALLIGLADNLHQVGRRWRYAGAITETLVDLRRLVLSPGHGPAIIGLCLLVHGLSVAVFWLLAQGQGFAFAAADALAIGPLILLVTVMPFAVGGWGVREGFVVALLGAGGVSPEDALLLSLSFGTCVLVAALPGLAILAATTWAPRARGEAGQRRPA